MPCAQLKLEKEQNRPKLENRSWRQEHQSMKYKAENCHFKKQLCQKIKIKTKLSENAVIVDRK